MKKGLFLAFIGLSSTIAFGATVNSIAQDALVKQLVTSLATQSLSGDPIYCSYNKPQKVTFVKGTEGAEFQIAIPCGSGSPKAHTMDRKIYVKGFTQGDTVYVTGVQLDEALPTDKLNEF